MASPLQPGGREGSRGSIHSPSPGLGGERILALRNRNRQRLRRVDLRLLRRIARALLQETWPNGSLDLAIYIVGEPEITRLNETFLRHKGSTDVITFDYAEGVAPLSRLSRRDAGPTLLHGEVFVCLDEALSQARRFQATWQSELVRYVVHGVLHLLGHDDLERRARRQMKAAEDALVRKLARQFDFHRLAHRAGPGRSTRNSSHSCPAPRR